MATQIAGRGDYQTAPAINGYEANEEIALTEFQAA